MKNKKFCQKLQFSTIFFIWFKKKNLCYQFYFSKISAHFWKVIITDKMSRLIRIFVHSNVRKSCSELGFYENKRCYTHGIFPGSIIKVFELIREKKISHQTLQGGKSFITTSATQHFPYAREERFKFVRFNTSWSP